MDTTSPMAADPFTPQAGTVPPVMAGRDDGVDQYLSMIRRLRAGGSTKYMAISGVRGTGKTALLMRLAKLTQQEGWLPIVLEGDSRNSDEFRQHVANLVLEAIQEAGQSRLRDGARAVLDYALALARPGYAAPGSPREAPAGHSSGITGLMTQLGEALAADNSGVSLLIDEVQSMDLNALKDVVMALHRTTQLGLPVAFAAAGLPGSYAILATSKSYAERMFLPYDVDRLSPEDSRKALREPGAEAGLEFTEQALSTGYSFSEGHPFFLQEYGSACCAAAWNSSTRAIDAATAEAGARLARDRMDRTVYSLRKDSCTVDEQRYLAAMARVRDRTRGPVKASDVAEEAGDSVKNPNGRKGRLIDKGIVYPTGHGYADFTLPGFGDYLLRTS